MFPYVQISEFGPGLNVSACKKFMKLVLI